MLLTSAHKCGCYTGNVWQRCCTNQGPHDRRAETFRVIAYMRDVDEIFAKLPESAFRRRFRLGPKDRAYLERKGLPVILDHARDFIDKRLAEAEPTNDGKQTPFRGHPVFVAQHATATCCRGCLAKWHGIPRGRPLQAHEKAHIITVLERWLRTQGATAPG